jgi:aspartyl-tRNA(Asn)/glutamyl-tRNA(Gln) amidotransferase subunit A
MELNQLTIHELQRKMKAGETTSTEIVQSVFRRIDAVEKDVHA